MRLGENVALARRQVGDGVLHRQRFESEPRNVPPSFHLEGQTSGFGVETGSEVFGNGNVDHGDLAKVFGGDGVCVAPVRIPDFDGARTQKNFFSEIFNSCRKKSYLVLSPSNENSIPGNGVPSKANSLRGYIRHFSRL